MAGERHAVVLVVDAEPDIRLLVRVNLELEGYEVLEAGSAAEAIAAMEKRAVDGVLLDLRLGNKSGFALGRELRLRWPHVPLALMTGSPGEGMASRGAEITQLVLSKPFARATLLKTVELLCAPPRSGSRSV